MVDTADRALSSKFESLSLKPSLAEVLSTQAIAAAEGRALEAVISRVGAGKRRIASERGVLAPLISKLQSKHAADIEHMVKQERLREAQRLKEELEQKLEHLQDRIEVMHDLQPSPKPHRANLLKQDIRRQYMEQEEARRRETSEHAKKWAEDQKALIKKRNQEAAEMQKVAQAEEAKKAEEELKEKEEALRRLKEQEKAKFEALAKKRKEYLESLSKLPVRRSPKLEKNVSLPALNHKEAVVKSSFESWADIKTHMRTYDQAKKSHDERSALENFMVNAHGANQPKVTRSKFMDIVEEEEARMREEQSRLQQDMRHRLEMKKRYGDIIKEMYAPEIDPLLREEIEKRPEKLHTKRREARQSPPRPHSWRGSSPKVPKKDSGSQKSSEEKKTFDYLTVLRKDRESEEQAILRRLKSPVKEAKDEKGTLAHMDEAVQRKEKLLQRLSPNRQALQAHFEVATDMLQTVKSKLALLQTP